MTNPIITIQCDWNEIIRLPHAEAWISSKYLNHLSDHGKIKTSLLNTGKIQVNLPKEYQYISHGALSLVVRHKNSGLKVAFVAPTTTHNVHGHAVLSVSTATHGLALSSCEGDKLLLWDSRTREAVYVDEDELIFQEAGEAEIDGDGDDEDEGEDDDEGAEADDEGESENESIGNLDKHLLDLKGHGGPVYKCRFFPSFLVVISAGADGSCRIWSAQSGINPVVLAGHTMAVTDVCIVERGRNVITVSKDGSAKLWDCGESRCLDEILEEQGPINCCALTTAAVTFRNIVNEREVGTANKVLVVGCEDGAVICSNVASREALWRTILQAPCNACIVIDDVIIAGCSDGKLTFLQLKDGLIIKELHESASPILSMTWLMNEMYVVGRQDGTCTVLSLREAFENVRVQLTGPNFDGIRDVTFNGKWIFTACRDTFIRKYDYNQVSIHFTYVVPAAS